MESKFIFEAKWQLHFAGAAAGMARGKLVGGKVSCSCSGHRQCCDGEGGNGYGKKNTMVQDLKLKQCSPESCTLEEEVHDEETMIFRFNVYYFL